MTLKSLIIQVALAVCLACAAGLPAAVQPAEAAPLAGADAMSVDECPAALRVGAPACQASVPANVLLPDLVPMPPTDINVSIYTVEGRRVLRMTTSFANIGNGRLELTGGLNETHDKTAVTQHIYAGDEVAAELPAGEFIYHPTHNHWHMEDFVRYELWTLDWEGGLDEQAGLTDKVSFCLRDTRRAPEAETVGPPSYFYCGITLQGISPGWVDTYTYDLPGQYIDITDLPSGVYAIRLVADPQNYILEKNDDNNTVRVNVLIEGRRVRPLADNAEYRQLLEKQRPGRLQAGEIP